MTQPAQHDWIIDCQRISKQFGDFVALQACDLKVPPNTIVGLLGPNGSGKTTLLRTLLGFQKPTSGTALVCGFDCRHQSLDVRRQVAYLPGDARLFRSMTGKGILEIFSGLSPHGNLQRMLVVAERLELDLRRRVMFMSTGMRQKLALSIVLGSVAPLIVLDEPTANLDPNVRGEVIAMVREVRSSGRTVLMSSHIFSDIEDTCDEVVILRSGQLVHNQRLADLDQLHIVQAKLDSSKVPQHNWPAFVVHQQRNDAAVELHLSGPPQEWLGWLQELPASQMRIERASVSSIYARFHRS